MKYKVAFYLKKVIAHFMFFHFLLDEIVTIRFYFCDQQLFLRFLFLLKNKFVSYLELKQSLKERKPKVELCLF